MPTEDHNSGRPHQVVPQGVLALMPPLKILVTNVGAALFVWGLLFAYLSSPAWAADITVNSLADDADGADGECTLREAITSACEAGRSPCQYRLCERKKKGGEHMRAYYVKVFRHLLSTF